MTEDQLLDALKKLEPSWKTNPLQNQMQQEVYTRPVEKRIARFRFDDMVQMPLNTGSTGGNDGGGGPPPPAMEQIACSGNLNGQPDQKYLFGPTGQ